MQRLVLLSVFLTAAWTRRTEHTRAFLELFVKEDPEVNLDTVGAIQDPRLGGPDFD